LPKCLKKINFTHTMINCCLIILKGTSIVKQVRESIWNMAAGIPSNP